MQLKLIKIFVSLILLCFFNAAFCQNDVKSKTDNLQNAKTERFQQLNNEFNNRKLSSDYHEMSFYSRQELTTDLKLKILDFLMSYNDRVYKILFSESTFTVQTSSDLDRKELFQLFAGNGFEFFSLNANNQQVKFVNDQEIIIPYK